MRYICCVPIMCKLTFLPTKLNSPDLTTFNTDPKYPLSYKHVIQTLTRNTLTGITSLLCISFMRFMQSMYKILPILMLK
jgi:hypothetical protein